MVDCIQNRYDFVVLFDVENGNPNGCGVPQWTPFGGGKNRTMIFDRECRMGEDHDLELIRLCPSRTVDFSKLMGSKK